LHTEYVAEVSVISEEVGLALTVTTRDTTSVQLPEPLPKVQVIKAVPADTPVIVMMPPLFSTVATAGTELVQL
jgi:hypothetical protein